MRRHQRAEPSKAREHPPRAREHPPSPRSLLVASPAAAGSIRRTRAAMAHRTYYCCSTASATSRLRLRAWRASWRSLRPPRSPCEHRTRSLLRSKAHVKAPAGWNLSKRTVSSSAHPQGMRVGSDRLSGSASRDCASSSRPSRDTAGPRIAATSSGTHREAQVRVPHKKRKTRNGSDWMSNHDSSSCNGRNGGLLRVPHTRNGSDWMSHHDSSSCNGRNGGLRRLLSVASSP